MIAQEKNRQSVTVTTNAYKLRGGDSPQQKPKNTRRVLVMGDSTTFGYGLAPEENYAFALQKILGSPQEYLVINGGVPGYSSFQNQVHWQDELRAFAPDVVILANAGINDLQDREQSDHELLGATQKNWWLKKMLFKSHFYLWLRKV